MSSETSHTRRAHTKSKRGCKGCKQRHVRCDEMRPVCGNCARRRIRCDLASAAAELFHPEATAAAGVVYPLYEPEPVAPHQRLVVGIEEKQITLAHLQEQARNLAPCTPLTLHGLPSNWSEHEVSLLFDAFHQFKAIEPHGGHCWSLGTSTFPMIWKLAFRHDVVRFILLGHQALAMAKIMRSSHMQNLVLQFRTLAFGAMRTEMARFSFENSDAVLGATLYLLALSSSSREWWTLLKGMAMIRKCMQPWKHLSMFQVLFDEPQQDTFLTSLSPSPEPPPPSHKESKAIYVDRMLNAARKLTELVKHEPLLTNPATNLQHIIYNLHKSPPAATPDNQFQAHTSLRIVHFMHPANFDKLTAGDPYLLAISAFYESLALAFRCLNPAGLLDYLNMGKARLISRIYVHVWERVFDREGQSDPAVYDLLEIVEVPYRIAQSFLNTGVAGFPAVIASPASTEGGDQRELLRGIGD